MNTKLKESEPSLRQERSDSLKLRMDVVKIVNELSAVVMKERALGSEENPHSICADYLEDKLRQREWTHKVKLEKKRLTRRQEVEKVRLLSTETELQSMATSKMAANHLQQLSPGVTSGMQQQDPLREQVEIPMQGTAALKPTFKFLETRPPQDDDICELETALGECVQTLEGHTAPVTACCVISDSLVLTTSLDSTIKVWNYQTGKFLLELECGKPVYCFQVIRLDDRKYLILPGCDDGRVPTWKLKISPNLKARCTNLISCHTPNPIRAMAASPDGTRLATGCCFYMHQINRNGSNECSTRGTLKLWDLKQIVDCGTAPRKYFHDVGHLNLKTMRQLVAPFAVRKISSSYLSSMGGNQGSVYKEHNLGIRAIAYSPDSSKILVGFGEPIDNGAVQHDKMLVLCCAATLSSLWVYEGVTHHINGMSFLASHSEKSGRSVWEVWPLIISTQRQLQQVHLHSSGASRQSVCLHVSKSWENAFSEPHQGLWSNKDGHYFASATGSVLNLWETSTGRKLGCLYGHEDTIITGSFSADGEIICTGSLDCTVKVWRSPLTKSSLKKAGTYEDDCMTLNKLLDADRAEERRQDCRHTPDRTRRQPSLPTLPEISPCPSPTPSQHL